MSRKNIHLRYAHALYKRAQKTNVVSQIQQDIQPLIEAYDNVQAFSNLLLSPVHTPKKKTNILEKALQGKLHPTTLTFLTFLISKRRETELRGILEALSELYKASHHIRTAYLTTARPISEELKKTVNTHIQKIYPAQGDIALITQTDPNLIGGYLIKINNQQLDMTLRGQLKRLQKQWEQAPLPTPKQYTP